MISHSFESWELGVRILKDSLKNLATFVNRSEANLSICDGLGRQTFSMLDECLLNDFNHITTSSADTSERTQDFRELLKAVVAVKTLINKLLLNDFPELVILKIANCGAINGHLE